MACLIGCEPGTVRDEIGEPAVNEKDSAVDARLKLVADWQSHFDLFHVKRSPFLSELQHEIAYEGDEERYKKYMGRFIDTAFGIPTDADESRRAAVTGTHIGRLPSGESSEFRAS